MNFNKEHKSLLIIPKIQLKLLKCKLDNYNKLNLY